MLEMLNLMEAIPYWTNKGFFQSIRTVSSAEIPWDSSDDALLDFYFFSQHSGKKLISPMLEMKLSHEGATAGTVPESDFLTICKVVYAIFGRNWNKLYATLDLNYNPIENYSMVEHEVNLDNENSTRTPNLTTTEYPDLETTVTPENYTTTTNNKIYGFDSSTASPSDDSIVTESGSRSTTQTGSNTTKETGTDQNASIRNGDRTLTRSGNIGVTTSQRMIESERKLWDWFFFSQVFKDLDSMLTLSIYC